MWEPDTLRAGPAGPGRSEDTMSGKNGKGAARAVPRAYGRLTRHERDTIQRMLERRASCREIARELGRSPSTVSAEVSSHRFVTAPKPRRGERVDAGTDLSAACPRLAAWPRCCNGCGRYRAIGCKRLPHVFYEARAAQLCADSVLVSSRRGIDADEPAAAARLEAIRDCLRRGLSPEQMAARNGGPVDLSPSTIYRWVSAGYDGMTNMELRRKVGYRPRRRAAGRAATRHSARRSYAGLATLMWTVPGGAQETGGPYMRDPRHPRHFTDEFKRQIVDLYNAGKPKREIMDEYDLGKSTVERWIKSINATGSPRAACNRTPEQNRILELERENRRLRMEVDVLKQAALIYARK